LLRSLWLAKSSPRSDPATVTFNVVEHPDGVTICAVYPSDREPNECRPGGKGRMNTRDNDVDVAWTVRVPQGVLFSGRTVNGAISARKLTALAEARTVNGSITVELPAMVNADLDMRTTNGSVSSDFPLTIEGTFSPRRVRATLGKGGPFIRLSTVNGSIRLRKA